MSCSQTESRKKDHIDIALNEDVQYPFEPGFGRMRFIHNALPEMNLDDVDLSYKFLGKNLSHPIIIEAMTGGCSSAAEINNALAEAAQKAGLAMGLGSQRAMLEDKSLAKTFQVRDVAPDMPILANIGAVQLKESSTENIENLVHSIDGDGIAIHLNSLQEVIQPEGDHDFSGVLNAIEKLCDDADIQVIVKETGAGLSTECAESLRRAGVHMIDVAGAGGTSWSRVEYKRKGIVPGFEDWGIPTVESIAMCKGILPMIASGGVRSGIDCAKAIALGADMAGAAFPFLKAYHEKRLDSEIVVWMKQMRMAAFLTGSRTHADLKKAKLMF
jgi:isopentenyl-diphosphate delta-isomerase